MNLLPLGGWGWGNFLIKCHIINKFFPIMQELEKQMYYGATPAIFERAFQLRRNMTPAEELLWNKLPVRLLTEKENK